MAYDDEIDTVTGAGPIRGTLGVELHAVCIDRCDQRIYDHISTIFRSEGYGHLIGRIWSYCIDGNGVTAMIEGGGEILCRWAPDEE